MGTITAPPPVKLFVGILTSLPEILPSLERQLETRFGPIDLQSDVLSFDATVYYDRDMGAPLRRRFLGFDRLIAPDTLARTKIDTNHLEAEWAHGGMKVARPVNLDPGYLELSKIVLASTKNFYHRILLAEGIYGEVTLSFRDGAWQSFPWTFPEFRGRRYDSFFLGLRARYREQLKEIGD